MKYVFIFVVIILSGLYVAYKRQSPTYQTVVGFTQGTTYQITYQDPKHRNLQSGIDSMLHIFDMSLSTYIDSSLISKLNKADSGIKPDELLFDVLTVSNRVFKESDGYFDVTVGPLVKAWGFGSEIADSNETDKIDSLKSLVGMKNLTLDRNWIGKSVSGINIDVNAIAQGYSVDYICNFLENYKIHNYLVEIGGEVKGKGKNSKNQFWRIGIDKPNESNQIAGNDLQAIVSLQNRALATSGNYRKFYIKDGVKVTHSINPITGYPVVSNLLSATILADDCTLADAYATCCMVMGFEESKKWLSTLKNIDAYLILGDSTGGYKIWMTPECENIISGISEN